MFTLTLALLGTLGVVAADEITSIDQQIKQIKEAPAKERVRLMNEFKLQLSTMNQDERTQALTKLRERIQVQTMKGDKEAQGEQAHNRIKEQSKDAKMTQEMKQTQERNKVQEQSRVSQMQEDQQMQQTQRMNQQHVGDQFAQQFQGAGQGAQIDIQTQPNGMKPSH